MAACDGSTSDNEQAGADPADLSTNHEHSAGPAHWGYERENGPKIWAELSPDYGLCGKGREQSPIDLRHTTVIENPPLVRDYQAASLRIIRHEHVVDVINNGHTIQVSYDEGSQLLLDEETYSLAQYHFHAPSEHTVDGRHYAMEMHLVHQSDAGELAVLGVLIKAGAYNPAFEPVWSHLPDEAGEEAHLENVQTNVDDLLPVSQRTYRYRGSLTTPPCSESVNWQVKADPIELSAEQINAFTSIMSDNNRPVQPLGERRLTIDPVSQE